MRHLAAISGALTLLLAPISLAQTPLPAAAPSLRLAEGLAIDGVSNSARRAINLDAMTAAIIQGNIADPASPAPAAGESLAPPPGVTKGDHTWKAVKADDQGNFDLGPGSYLLIRITSESDRVMLLRAAGHALLYDNAQPRMGDPYSAGAVITPIALRKGENRLLFASAGRGPLHAELVEPPASGLSILTDDLTLPDLVQGESEEFVLGLRILNATTTRQVCSIRYTDSPSGMGALIDRFAVEPLSIRRVAASTSLAPQEGTTEVPLDLTLERLEERARANADRRTITLRALPASAPRRVTFRSRIDDSVQYYAVVPPTSATKNPGLVLSLHGASVEATSQAGSYAAKPDLVIVCPTNRRPFGFDWEDWGRADAMEALAHAASTWHADPLRRYLTGHSMGGHGTWQLASHYPGRFAALAPSAGWLSFASYGGSASQTPGSSDDPRALALAKAAAASDTPALLPRLTGKGIYILHGDADDNVPVSQARTARELLTTIGIAHQWHEQPGAGHWWDDDKPGAACVDWPPIFELFAKSRLASPAPDTLETELLDANSLPKGSFKRAFADRFQLVYPTKGTPEQNRAAYAKARFDAEQWSYRGNGAASLAPDTAVLQDPAKRNRILYGNSEINAAWSLIDPAAKASITASTITLGDEAWTGEDLGALLVLPAKNGGLIGIVAGTSIPGQRSLERLPYFTSGTGFPDVLIVRAGVWTQGLDAVVKAGR